MTDEKGSDEKILCASLRDPAWSRVHDIHDLQPEFRDEIEHFFQVYKAREKSVDARLRQPGRGDSDDRRRPNEARRHVARRVSAHPAYDVHQHLWPEAFIAELVPGASRRASTDPCSDSPASWNPRPTSTPTTWQSVSLLDRHGIDVAVVSIPPGYVSDPDELARAYHNGDPRAGRRFWGPDPGARCGKLP